MARQTAIRFRYGSTTLDFYNDEVRLLVKKKSQPASVGYLKNRKPFIQHTGKAHSIIMIDFILDRKVTRANIETLRSQTALQCFYRYGFDSAATYSVTCKMVKDQVTEPYVAGHKKAKETIRATFIEIAGGTVAPIIPDESFVGVA